MTVAPPNPVASEHSEPKAPVSQAEASPRVSVRALLFLVAVVIGSWATWAVLYHTSTISSTVRASSAGVLARLAFWVVPSFSYLFLRYRANWSAPLGLGFPYGGQQVVRAIVTALVVGALLVIGTSVQFGHGPMDLVRALVTHGNLNLEAPIFEEIVFRGVITSEALTWASESSTSLPRLRRRFWLAQAGSAFVFLVVHWPYYLMTLPLGEVLTRSAGLLVTGLVLGFSFAQTRSIYVCIFLHWLNNALSALSSG
jgi:membrane protease YdiL (CAAX protease family)